MESVLNQTFQDFEIIILDDYSTDQSKKVIESYRDNEKVVHVVYNESNSGSTFIQWQKGIELAKSDLIWIAESDDYAAPVFLETLLKPFKASADVVISFCRSMHVDENDKYLGLTLHADVLDGVKWTKDYVEKGYVELRDYLQFRNTIPNASAVVFKKPANLEHFLSTQMKYCGDWLFWKNLLNQPYSMIAYCHQPLNFFRTHANTTRYLSKSLNIDSELKRFAEYKTFVPRMFMNPFDSRFRWMMAEWIDRGVAKALKNTRYRFFPKLHPALVVRYYMYSIKNIFKSKPST